MQQLTLAAVGFERYAKITRRAAFLAEMKGVVPWLALCAVIEPFYPKPGNGRPPVGVERMRRRPARGLSARAARRLPFRHSTQRYRRADAQHRSPDDSERN